MAITMIIIIIIVIQTININTGLFALKRCIEALNERQAIIEERKLLADKENENHACLRPLPHVPYQDSKLTMILSSVIGSNNLIDANVGKLAMIITIDAEDGNALESIHSLRFAEQVSCIKSLPSVSDGDIPDSTNNLLLNAPGNELARILASLDSRIKTLQSQMATKEKWILNRTVTHDPIDGREIVKNITVLTGAEHLHRQIEELVNRREEIMNKCTYWFKIPKITFNEIISIIPSMQEQFNSTKCK